VPVGVSVEPAAGPERLEPDEWLEVTGVLVHRKREWVVRASRIDHIDPPSQPYLSFST